MVDKVLLMKAKSLCKHVLGSSEIQHGLNG